MKHALSRAACLAVVFALMATLCVVPQDARADSSIFTSAPKTTVYEGFGYFYQVTASEPVTSWSISGGEPIFSINQTGFVSSTGGGTLGTSYSMSIAATTAARTYHQNYTLTVISMFTSSPVIAGQEGVGYSYQVATHDGGVAWNMTGPSWLSINDTGAITGTPPVGAAGEYEIVVSVWTHYGDSLGKSNQVYNLTVIQNPGLVFTSTPPTTVYAAYGYAYQVTTSINITSWSISGGDAWLFINETGFVYTTGTFGVAGNSFQISIVATAGAVTYHQNYTLTIIDMFSSVPITTARDDVAYSYQAISREPVTTWSISGATWLNISSSGLITGTPPIGAAGQYQITVSVWTQYGEGLYRSNQAYTLTVLPNAAYAITSEPVTNATANITYSYQVTSRYTVTSWYLEGPEWLHVSSSGLISGTSPNGTDGSFNVSVRLTLTDGSLAWQNYTLEVVRQPYTADDGMAMAFGMLAFMMVISAIVGMVAMARRR